MGKCYIKRTSAIFTDRRNLGGLRPLLLEATPIEPRRLHPEATPTEPDREDIGRVQTLTQHDPVLRRRMPVDHLPMPADHPRTPVGHLPGTEVVSTKANRLALRMSVRIFPALVRERTRLLTERANPAWREHLPAVAGVCTASRTVNQLDPIWLPVFQRSNESLRVEEVTRRLRWTWGRSIARMLTKRFGGLAVDGFPGQADQVTRPIAVQDTTVTSREVPRHLRQREVRRHPR